MIALLLAAPLRGPVFPDWLFEMTETMRPPDDLSVPAEEHALRDLIPGWEPVRALTEDEMAWVHSPHQMMAGGFPAINPRNGVPTIPAEWVRGWPEPAPLVATGVPRGWWWKPRDPERFGGWLVLCPGRSPYVFYAMVTEPLRTIDYGSLSPLPAMNALYAALRDREAKRRGVDPAVLDEEAKQVQRFGHIPSAIEGAIGAIEGLVARDRPEEALELLAMALEEDPGSPREHLKALVLLGVLHVEVGEVEAGIRSFEEARALARSLDDQGRFVQAVLTTIGSELPDFERMRPWSPARRLAERAKQGFGRGYLDAAKGRFEQVLSTAGEGDDEARWLAHGYLAIIASAQRRDDDARDAARRALRLPTPAGHDKVYDAIRSLAGEAGHESSSSSGER
ncbi:MAG: hypothetical protein R3F65_32400 [bacterium]